MATGAGIYFDGMTSARHQRRGRARARGAAHPSTPTARCSPTGPMASSSTCRRPTTCCASAAPATRCWRASKSATPRSPHAIDELRRHARPHRRDRAPRPPAGDRLDVAATVSLVLVAVFGVPALADRIAPLIPLSVEQRARDAVDAQVRAMLDTGRVRQAVRMRRGRDREGRPRRARQAGQPPGDRGRPADPAQDRGGPPQRGQRHCTAGRPYLRVRGAGRAKAESPTSSPASSRTRSAMSPIATARVAAASRRPVVSVRHAARRFHRRRRGGDRGADRSCSRPIRARSRPRPIAMECELMTKIGGDPRAFAAILERIAGAIEPGIKILLDHPQTKDRVAAINAAPSAPIRRAPKPLLDARRMGGAQAHLRVAHGAPPHRRRADVAAGHLGAPLRVVLARRDRARGPDRALRAARDRAGARHLRRRAGVRRDRHRAGVRRLRRDLAATASTAPGYAFAAHRASASRCSPIRPISAIRAYSLPMINDITTDPIDPPRFDDAGAAAPARHRSTMPASTPPSSSARPIPTSSR